MSSGTFSDIDSEHHKQDESLDVSSTALNLLPPPNPLFQRSVEEQVEIEWIDLPYGKTGSTIAKNPVVATPFVGVDYATTLFQHFANRKPIYQKFQLSKDRKQYASLINVNKRKLQRSSIKSDLRFDSGFESGNLFEAYAAEPGVYELVLQNDTNTQGYTQWFFFSVCNARPKQKVTFRIVNVSKLNKQFDDTFTFYVVTHSSERKKQENLSWVRERVPCTTYRNRLRKENREECYWTLEFQYQFQWSNDKVYFAAHYPYTYTHLRQMLTRYQHTELHETSGGFSCPLVTLTSNQENATKLNVLFMGRQHPGEVTGSFVIEGILEFLVGKSFEAEYLREHVVFRVVPMMNIDGVVYGHQRCTLQGVDMNRRWRQDDAAIAAVKQVLTEHKHHLVVDFHSHSRKAGGFFYGNTGLKGGASTFASMVADRDKRVDFRACRFLNLKSETQLENTARVVIARMLGSNSVYTFETSYDGYFEEKNKFVHFTVSDFKAMGRSVCLALFRQLYRHSDLRRQAFPLLDGVSQSDSDPSDDQLDAKQELITLQASLPVKAAKARPMSQNSSRIESFNFVRRTISSEYRQSRKVSVGENCRQATSNKIEVDRRVTLLMQPTSITHQSPPDFHFNFTGSKIVNRYQLIKQALTHMQMQQSLSSMCLVIDLRAPPAQSLPEECEVDSTRNFKHVTYYCDFSMSYDLTFQIYKFIIRMTDQQQYEGAEMLQYVSELELKISQYLHGLGVRQLTDAQLKEYDYFDGVKKHIFETQSTSDGGSVVDAAQQETCTMTRTCSLNITHSSLAKKRSVWQKLQQNDDDE